MEKYVRLKKNCGVNKKLELIGLYTDNNLTWAIYSLFIHELD